MAFWALAAIVGVVEAPGVVVGAGIIAFGLVVGGGLMAARALRNMTRPLDDLIEASTRIEAGDYGVQVPVGGGGGVRSLTRAFNQMSTQLQVADERRRVFLADVTHELRTPLTVIQGQLEAIEQGIYEADPEHIASLLSQARLMSGLVEDLHTIARAEVGALALDITPTDLNDIAEQVVASLAPTGGRGGVELRLQRSPNALVAMLDVAATRRVLANIVGNAITHATGASTIVVSVDGDAAAGRIDVSDDGPGMPPELVTHAFERFTKGDASRGSGLGLAIARDLVVAQGGTVELSSTVGVGTRISISVPLR